MKTNQAALDVGQLAWDMARGYAAHIAAIRMAPRLDPQALLRLIGDYPTDFVQRKDGTRWLFGTQDALLSAVADEAIAEEFPRVWLTGSLLAVGDALTKHDYFGRAPLFELVRHLRNGIAHGNRFHIRPVDKLKYPAHNGDADYRGPNSSLFEITPALNWRPVLFEFMGAGDVLDLLQSVGARLQRMGRGEAD